MLFTAADMSVDGSGMADIHEAALAFRLQLKEHPFYRFSLYLPSPTPLEKSLSLSVHLSSLMLPSVSEHTSKSVCFIFNRLWREKWKCRLRTNRPS